MLFLEQVEMVELEVHKQVGFLIMETQLVMELLVEMELVLLEFNILEPL